MRFSPNARVTVQFVLLLSAWGAVVAVLGERVSWNQPVGAVVVILGVVVGQGRLALRRAVPAAAVAG